MERRCNYVVGCLEDCDGYDFLKRKEKNIGLRFTFRVLYFQMADYKSGIGLRFQCKSVKS